MKYIYKLGFWGVYFLMVEKKNFKLILRRLSMDVEILNMKYIVVKFEGFFYERKLLKEIFR